MKYKEIGSAGLALIKKFEGCRLEAYEDVAGVSTIGYGHTAGVTAGQKITQAQAEQLLKEDCQKFAGYVDDLGRNFNDNQRDALISFAFNLGPGNLKKVTVNNRPVEQIAAAMPLYCNAAGKKLEGLVKRRAAEVKLFNTPVASTASVHAAEVKQSGDEWVRRLQAAIGAKVDGIAGKETLSKCPTIKKGSDGEVVKLMQERLGNVFRIGVTGGYDGDFGTGTYNAVVEFQRQNGLTKDGVVGQNTWKKILGL